MQELDEEDDSDDDELADALEEAESRLHDDPEVTPRTVSTERYLTGRAAIFLSSAACRQTS